MKDNQPHIVVIFGTRPEVIKLASVIHEVKKNKITLVSIGQHSELLNEAMEAFKLKADIDLKIMKHGQTLSEITGKAVTLLDTVYKSLKPSLTLVVGDTASAFAGALVSFYHQISIAHIEAGCRSFNRYEPFPEEINRKLISVLANWHFTSGKIMTDNLIHEGYHKENIFCVGSTEVDAIDYILKNKLKKSDIIPFFNDKLPFVVVTTHRRENWGKPMERIFLAISQIAKKYPKLQFVYSLHPNPQITSTAKKLLKDLGNIFIVTHTTPDVFVPLVQKAQLIITDSGGVQLQAGALVKPVLILRNVTEWMEVIEQGVGRLVGTDEEKIVSAFEDFISGRWPDKIPQKPIYQKGAAKKIAKIITTKILS